MFDRENNVNENTMYEPFKKVYYSDITGSCIVDAITGAKYPYKVGSINEKKFFKVRSTTAYKNLSAKLQYNACASITNQAFYENPEVYMNYHSVQLSEDIIQKWKDRLEV